MAALTDGTKAGTIESSPVVPAPVAADTSTGAGNPLTGQDATAKIPTTTVSSKTASDYVTDKITPALANASTEIANNNQKMATALPPDDPTNKFNTATGQANSKYVDPNPPTKTDTTSPNPGYKFAYDTGGNQSQIPIEDSAATYGLFDINPKAGPTTKVSGSVTDTSSDTYKQFADGTYGMYDASGKYQGVASAQDFQNAQDATSLLSSLYQLANGSYPLTVDQQAQIVGLQATFKGLIDEQKVSNQNLTGGTTVAMNLYGMGNSIAGLGIIKGTVDSGLQKIADLNTKLVTAVAQMKAGFQKDNHDMIKSAYDEYNQAAKDKQAQLDKITKEASDAAAAVQDRKDKLRNYNLNVAQFQQTKDQNAFDNALKTEAQVFDEKYKTKTLALEQFKAGYGSNGGPPGSQSIPSAKITSTGAVDPASQKATLAQISQIYGPMTATAIKGLADYSMNPTDWSTRATKTGGMSREQAVTLAKTVDPNYDDSQFAVRKAMKENISSGSYSKTISAANTLIQHLSLLQSSFNSLGNTGSVATILNPLKNFGMGALGSGKTTAVQTAIDAVATEAATVYKGGTPTEAEIASWKEKMNQNMSPNQMHTAVQTITDLMAGKLSTISDEYKGVMGTPLSAFAGGYQVLTDRNAETLKNLGIDPSTVDPTYADATATQQKAISSLQSFNDANPENAKMLDEIHTQYPGLSASEIANQLGL